MECKKFCVTVISLLSHAYISETPKKGKKQIAVNDLYKQEWLTCIKELWLLGMQGIAIYLCFLNIKTIILSIFKANSLVNHLEKLCRKIVFNVFL